LSKGQAEQLYNWFIEGVKQNYELQAETRRKENAEAHKKLRDLWGADYSTRMDLAKKVVMKYGDDETKANIERAGMKNSPGLAVMLSRIGQDLGEDFLITGSVKGHGPTTEEEKRIERLKQKYPSMFEETTAR